MTTDNTPTPADQQAIADDYDQRIAEAQAAGRWKKSTALKLAKQSDHRLRPA